MLKRITTLTVDQQGNVTPGGHLSPGIYVVSEDTPRRAIPPVSRSKLANWIDRCVLGDLTTLHDGIRLAERRRLKRKRGGGNYLLAAGCCMALEYMAHVYTGDENATASIRKYANDFLAPIDKAYSDVADLMWRAFRNGLVHGSWPQTIEAEAHPGVRIRLGVGNELADEHLAPIPGVDGPSFGISAPRLIRDLKRSFKAGLRPWILHQSPNAVLERGGSGLLTIAAGDKPGNKQFNLVTAWRPGA